jgi:acetyltransferase-like isoleucine patch superfamily enzyme
MMDAIRLLVKRTVDAISMALVSPAAAMCGLEARTDGETVFSFWAQLFALVPGLPGVFLRRAFYRLTLESCGRTFFIGFGALFSHRLAHIEDDVYVGPYAVIGSCHLGKGCLIGTRCSIVSGGGLHTLDAQLRWMPTDLSRLTRVHVGAHAWIGESALVLADIGSSAMVAAGAVVSTAVPAGTVVAGNPARFVRRLSASA